MNTWIKITGIVAFEGKNMIRVTYPTVSFYSAFTLPHPLNFARWKSQTCVWKCWRMLVIWREWSTKIHLRLEFKCHLQDQISEPIAPTCLWKLLLRKLQRLKYTFSSHRMLVDSGCKTWNLCLFTLETHSRSCIFSCGHSLWSVGIHPHTQAGVSV